MAQNYKTPGIYTEEIPKLPPSVAQVETSVAIFIGYTAKATDGNAPLPSELIDGIQITQAKRISSLIEYELYFGRSIQKDVTVTIHESYAAANDPLLNRDITVTGPTKATLYNHMQLYFANGGGACYIVSVGADAAKIAAADLFAGLKMAARYDEPSITVIPQVTQLSSVVNSGKVYNAALQQAADLQDRFVILDCYGDDPQNLRDNTGTTNLQYGAAYHPFLQLSYGNIVALGDPSIKIKLHKTIAGSKDVVSNVLYNDLAPDVKTLVSSAVAQKNIVVPPCCAIAGIYANVDSTRGVWKSPANVNINYIAGLTKQITDEEQEGLNVDEAGGKSINAIRAFTGKGNLVWGGRTLMGNDNEWRYVSVRRFFTMVEESVKKAIASFVFEPNDANTWIKIQSMLENYLTLLWREGALMGAKPEEAFYVAIGLNKTMTSLDILNGQLIVEIGMAAVRPAEFVMLRITQKMTQS